MKCIMTDEKKVFQTRDIYLATTLITLRFLLVGIDYQVEGENRRPVGYFNFDDTQALRDAQNSYWQGRLSIEPKQFITNLRSLKAQINNEYKGPRSEVASASFSESRSKAGA